MLRAMTNEIRWAFNAVSWKPTQQQLLVALSSISFKENERIQKFRFREDYKLCLIGRLLIRNCVHKLLGMSWKDIILARTEKGKPFLVNGQQTIYFNISHQGDYSVLAASTNHNIGIDIMKFAYPNNTDIPSFFNIMKRQFVEKEWEYVYSFGDEFKQLKAFYRLWCLKESYVKAIGTGIGTNSAERLRFDIETRELNRLSSCNTSVLYVNELQEQWCFNETLLDADHIVTVATNSGFVPHSSSGFEFLRFEELIEHSQEIIPPDTKWWTDFEVKHTKGK